MGSLVATLVATLVSTLAATLVLPVPASAPRAAAAGVSISVFPVEPKCSYVDTWLAPRSGGRQHLGVDIIATAGANVYAPDDGVVTKITLDGPTVISGNAMRFARDDGTYFFMGHFSAFAPGIAVGKRYKAGEVIAYVGRTGNTSVNHLHFEVHPGGGAAVNPTPIVRAVDRCYTNAPPPTTAPTTTTPATTVPTTMAPPTTTPPQTGGFVANKLTPISTSRAIDTRDGSPEPPTPGQVAMYSLAGSGVPADATAAHLTVWATGAGSAGHVAVVPCANPAAPTTTTLFVAGRTTGSSVVTALRSGNICLTASAPVNVVVDVHAYASPSSRLGAVVTRPLRVFDSAWANKLLVAGQPRTLRVVGAAGFPAAGEAVTMTLTTRSSSVAGTVKAYPCDGSPSAVPVAIVSNQETSVTVTTKVAATGMVCLLSSVDVSVTLDVTMAWTASGAALRPMQPIRAMSTRAGAALAPGQTKQVSLSGVPSTSAAVAVNVFTITPGARAEILVHPCGSPATVAATVVGLAGVSTSGSTIVSLGNGALCVTSRASSHVVVDVTAYAG